MAGVFLLILIVGLGDLVAQIPMPALVAIMIMVSIGTFSWSSVKTLRTHPRSSSIVMLATVAVVVYTHNLAIGVLVGVLLSGIFFAGKIAQLFRVTSELSADGRARTYRVEGQLFYASVEDFMAAFEALDTVIIDVTGAHIWDISSVQALDMAVLKLRRDGAEVRIIGMNEASETIVDRLAMHDKPGAIDKLMAIEGETPLTERIFALVDGSVYSESVCHHAAWAAQRLGASVEVMHVLGRREAPEKADLSGALQLGARTALLTCAAVWSSLGNTTAGRRPAASG